MSARIRHAPGAVARVAALLAGCALLPACAAPVVVDDALRADPRLSLPVPDYRAPGGHAVATSHGAQRSPHGCRADFVRYRPSAPAVDATVVLAHGFLRGPETLDGLARHLARWGIPVVSVALCDSTLLAGHHDRNADALRAVARGLGLQHVIYAGFSAGGLSALLAAAADPAARAAVLLDPVDAGGLAAPAARAARVPVFALLAPPAACNRDSNAVDALREAAELRMLRLAGASHCHFEIPLDAACTALCGGSAQRGAVAPLQGLVLGLTTAAALAGAGADGRAWWQPHGEALSRLLRSGRVEPP